MLVLPLGVNVIYCTIFSVTLNMYFPQSGKYSITPQYLTVT